MSDIKNEKTAAPIGAPAKPAETLTMEQVLQLVPAIAAATASAMQKGQTSAAPARAASPKAVQKCHECGQALTTGCGGKHVMMVVYPQRYPQHADYFPGVQINGVRYLSNNENHAVLVPANAESVISGIVATFEQNEQDMAVGRKAVRHSGTVSPHGTQVQPANQAWR